MGNYRRKFKIKVNFDYKFRTDNCVKNHFYSRLRKGLRKINKFIDDYNKTKFK